MTEEELLQAGYHEFFWNNGVIMEYWKSFTNDADDFDNRLGVRFGETNYAPFVVWLFTRNSMLSLPRIQTLAQLQQFYDLVRR